MKGGDKLTLQLSGNSAASEEAGSAGPPPNTPVRKTIPTPPSTPLLDSSPLPSSGLSSPLLPSATPVTVSCYVTTPASSVPATTAASTTSTPQLLDVSDAAPAVATTASSNPFNPFISSLFSASSDDNPFTPPSLSFSQSNPFFYNSSTSPGLFPATTLSAFPFSSVVTTASSSLTPLNQPSTPTVMSTFKPQQPAQLHSPISPASPKLPSPPAEEAKSLTSETKSAENEKTNSETDDILPEAVKVRPLVFKCRDT